MQSEGGLQYILASGSPRRRELMDMLTRDFIVEIPSVNERIPEGVPADAAAEYLSKVKAKAVFDNHPDENAVVIGSDTVVIEGGRILGKPNSYNEAFEMLKSLSGKAHEVRTGITVIYRMPKNGEVSEFSFTSVSEVEFYELTEEDIAAYIKTGEPMDKAGAYGIQGKGGLFVKRINGDYFTIVGFPVGRLNRELKIRGMI